MTIMVAGGLTFAIPGVMPEAMAANANLYVSAENSEYSNTMTGPQVVEVVIIDSDINETNESNGEPDVTINGKKLRMAQATDGNWYGYFADKSQAINADQTTITQKGGVGLDFGQFCGGNSNKLNADETTIMFGDTVGVALPIRTNSTGFGVNGTTTITDCNLSFHGRAGGYGTYVTIGTGLSVITANSTHTILHTKTNSAGTTSAETVSTGVAGTVENVVREAKKINTNSGLANGIGQIGLLDDGLWPFIQLYDLTTGGNVVIKYNKGGGVQTTTLLFDTVDASESLDRSKYPQGAQVHFTINDIWLNIDPTDEDSWTFDTAGPTYAIHYQVFNENGVSQGDSSTTANKSLDITSSLGTLMAEEGVLKIAGNPQSASTVPLVLQDNGDTDQDTTCTTLADCRTDGGAFAAGTQPVTMVETEAASGTFTSFDESDVSQLKIASGAVRGSSATISYADAHTILVGNEFATIDIMTIDDEWSSGEEIPVVIVDADQNKNTRADEDLQVVTYTNSTLIPALQTGDPFTLGENRTSAGVATTTAIFADWDGWALNSDNIAISDGIKTNLTVSKFSEIALIDPIGNAASADGIDAIVIDYNLKLSEFYKTVKRTTGAESGRLLGINLLNLDVTAFNATGTFDVYLLNSTNTAQIINPNTRNTISGGVGSMLIANDVDPKSLTSLNNTMGPHGPATLFDDTTTNYVGLLIVSNQASTKANNAILDGDAAIPIVADFFSFGFTDDGAQSSERVQNQIIRVEVEESGDNTNTFEGSLEYVMVNQLNIYSNSTYTGISPISDSASFIVIEDLTDEDSPRLNYLDLGSDGVSTQIADQEAAPTHSGVVSLDSENYKVADTVTVTLEDADLNTDSELIDIYTVVKSGSATYDMVGKLNDNSLDLPTFGWGALGRLVDITFDDEQWLKGSQGSVTCVSPNAVQSSDDGLGATNFALIETGIDSGVFVGDFQIPADYCKRSGYSGANGVATSTTGVDIEVNYVDFRDASGEIIEVGDGAGVRANTGSVTLDRTVYPVPFSGSTGDFASNTSSLPNGRALFPSTKLVLIKQALLEPVSYSQMVT